MSLWRKIAVFCKRVVDARIRRIRTMTIGQVVEYNSDNNTVKIRLCVRSMRSEDPANETTVELGILEDVTVKQRGSGKLVDTMPPAVDSYGEVRFAHGDIEAWLLAGGVVDPANLRKFDLSDAVFDPGVYPLVEDGDNGMLAEPVKIDRSSKRTRSGLTEISVLVDESIFININDGNASITIDKDGNVTIIAAGDLSATADGDITIDGASVTVNGPLDVNGNFTVDE